MLERAHITDKLGDMPKLPAPLLGMAGWVRASSESEALRPRGASPLCWTEGSIAYFYPSMRDLCGMIQRHCKLSLSPQRLREILERAGVAIKNEEKDGHKSLQKRGPGTKRPLAIRLDALLPLGSEGETVEAEQGE